MAWKVSSARVCHYSRLLQASRWVATAPKALSTFSRNLAPNSVQIRLNSVVHHKMSTSSSLGAAGGAPFGKNRIPEITASLEPSSGICTITINRPDKANAFNLSMYKSLGDLLRESDADPSVKIMVLTGNGKFFSAGNDLSIWENEDKSRSEGASTNVIRDLVDSLIDLRKPLLALVNGPAIGIGATMLAHCDAVYAAKSAYFLTPFTRLGICAEACSSYLFPKMMGSTRATELLMFNAKIGAEEAASLGLVTRVFSDASFAQDTSRIAEETAKLPHISMMTTKELIRGPERERLHAINRVEFERVGELTAGEECKQAARAFLESKGKKK